jgi:hypothetical protein
MPIAEVQTEDLIRKCQQEAEKSIEEGNPPFGCVITDLDGKVIKGARIFPRQDLDMIELYDPDVDACGYVSTEKMAATAHVKRSEETNL